MKRARIVVVEVVLAVWSFAHDSAGAALFESPHPPALSAALATDSPARAAVVLAPLGVVAATLVTLPAWVRRRRDRF